MPMLPYLLAAGEAVGWVWENRVAIGPYADRLLDSVIARDGTTIDRIGAALVAQQGEQQK